MTGAKLIRAVLLLSFHFLTSTSAVNGEIGEQSDTALSIEFNGVSTKKAFIATESDASEDSKEKPTVAGADLRERSTVGIPSSWNNTSEEYTCGSKELKFTVNKISQTWEQARKQCKQNEGDLASILSFDELNMFDKVVVPDKNLDEEEKRAWIGKFWIGLNDRATEGKFVWSDGRKGTYRFWMPGEPNNYYGLEDCVIAMYRGVILDRSNGAWQDEECRKSFMSVCKHKGEDARSCTKRFGTSNYKPAAIPAKQRSDLPLFAIKEGILKIVGKTVYMSDVARILETKPGGYMGKLDPKKTFNLVIKTDTFYCDKKGLPQDNAIYTLFGISRFNLTARHVEFDNCLLKFTFDGMSFKDELLPKNGKNGQNGIGRGHRSGGGDGTAGQRGLDGLNGTTVTLAYLTSKGNLDINIYGMTGTEGGHGSDGGHGTHGEDSWCIRTCKGSCIMNRAEAPGGNGAKGGHAGPPGLPGYGGNAGRFNLFSQKSADTGAKIHVTGYKGKTGPEGKLGKRGKGGKGGRGFGKVTKWICNHWRPYGGGPFCATNGVEDCSKHKGKGYDGRDGDIWRNYQESVEGASLQGKISTKKEDFQPYFDDVVQQLVLRKAEDLYIEGETAKAKDILETAKELMKSDKRQNIEYCNKLIEQITSGLNFFGKRDNEFSTEAWTTAASRANDLVQRASDQATRINTLLNQISLMDVMKSTNNFLTTALLTQVENEMNEIDRKMKYEEIKKTKAIEIMEQMEFTMSELASKMKQDLEKALKARDENYAHQAVQFALTLFAGLLTFGDSLKDNKLGAASQIVTGTQEMMEYGRTLKLRNTKGRNCKKNYNDMEAFAKKMMKLQLIAPSKDTSRVSLERLDTVAKAELLKVQALEKRDDLLLGFKCLIEAAGFKGDVLEGTIGAFFDYSFSRITVFGQVIQHDINSRQLQFKKERLETTIKSLKDANDRNGADNFNPLTEKARLLHKENLLEVFRKLEKDVLYVLYEQAMAFQFITLWDTKFIEELQKARKGSHEVVSDQYLRKLQNYLKKLHCQYNKCNINGGPDKVDDVTYLWMYTPKTHKTLFENIHANGRGYFTINKDGVCSKNGPPKECVNMRLKKIYVEVTADFGKQRSIAIEISHSGSNFFFTAPTGLSNVTYYQPKELWKVLKNYKHDRGTTDECSQGHLYCGASFAAKANGGISMCSSITTDIREKLLGTTACRSLFSQYTIYLPKNNAETSSIRKNSKHFDWKTVTKIKFFASMSGFRNPKTMESCKNVDGCGKKKNEVKDANESNKTN